MPADLEADLVEEGFSSVELLSRLDFLARSREIQHRCDGGGGAGDERNAIARASSVARPLRAADPCMATFRSPIRTTSLSAARSSTRRSRVRGCGIVSGHHVRRRRLERTRADRGRAPAIASLPLPNGSRRGRPDRHGSPSSNTIRGCVEALVLSPRTTPDDALLDAADKGELYDVTQIRAQVERLSLLPGARETNRRFSESTSTSTGWPTWPKTRLSSRKRAPPGRRDAHRDRHGRRRSQLRSSLRHSKALRQPRHVRQ